jgi:hypothetical protein
MLGTCVNCFDEDGESLISELPWTNVSDFAYAEENARVLTEQEFLTISSPFIQSSLSTTRDDLQYLLSEDGVLMVYDQSEDIHYFVDTNITYHQEKITL